MGRDLDRIDINFVTPNTIKWLETIGAVPQGASVERYTRETTSRRSRIALDYRPWVLHASESSAAQSLKVIGVYRNNTLTHTVVDTGTCLVDMTKYVDNHTFPDDSARDECPRRTTFQIAMELLNIYGADWFGVDGGPLLEDVCFTNNFSEVTAVDPPLTASLRSLLMQARPDAKHLKEFFKTLVEIGPSIPAQLTIGKLAPDKAVDFVVTHKRWPYTSSELMTGSTIRVVFPRFGLQLEPYIDTKLPGVGVFSAKLPQASSADGYLLYKSNPAREWEARLPIHIPVSITKYSKKNPVQILLFSRKNTQ